MPDGIDKETEGIEFRFGAHERYQNKEIVTY